VTGARRNGESNSEGGGVGLPAGLSQKPAADEGDIELEASAVGFNLVDFAGSGTSGVEPGLPVAGATCLNPMRPSQNDVSPSVLFGGKVKIKCPNEEASQRPVLKAAVVQIYVFYRFISIFTKGDEHSSQALYQRFPFQDMTNRSIHKLLPQLGPATPHRR